MPANAFESLQIPDPCVSCPSLQGHIAKWVRAQRDADQVLDANFSHRAELVRELNEDSVRAVASRHGEHLDPSDEQDRNRAFDLISADEYEHRKSHTEREEVAVHTLLRLCQNKGPKTFHLPIEDGDEAVIAICSGDLVGSCEDHTHQVPVDIRREASE